MASVNSSDQEELLVFGYSCKLFRDDERALLIDRGAHLIPWMGDDKLKIDRYDGRGALHDLSQFEPQSGGFEAWSGLSERERKLEQLLNEERYLALYRDEDEERMLKEEEWKRLNVTGYNQANFSYDQERGTAEEVVEEPHAPPEVVQPEEHPYVPPETLVLPPDMQLPETRRHADVIERTADFVARKGPQMEILIKAKQSDNSMFNFLSYDDSLQPFFRHLVVMIKAGRFTIGKNDEPADKANQESTTADTKNFNRSDVVNDRSDSMYQPDTNCAYQMLIKNIRSRQQNSVIFSQRASSPAAPLAQCEPAPADSPALSPTQVAVTPSRPSSPATPPSSDAHSSPSRSPETTCSVPEASDAASLTRLKPVSTTTAALPSVTVATTTETTATTVRLPSVTVETPSAVKPSSFTATTPVQLPPAERRLIIDKMASYVAKNGRDFEVIVLARGDERFNFLRESHEYQGYYRQKLSLYEAELDRTDTTSSSTGALAAPVSFSIRGRRQEEPQALEPSALPVEESSEEEQEGRVEEDDPNISERSSTNAAEMINKWVAKAGPSRSIVARGRSAGTTRQSSSSSKTSSSSAKTSSSNRTVSSTNTDCLRQERRRRAAQFMARMRTAIKDKATPSSRSQSTTDADRSDEMVSGPVFGPVFDPSYTDEDSLRELPDQSRLNTDDPIESAGEDERNENPEELSKYKLVESSEEERPSPTTEEANLDTHSNLANEFSTQCENKLEKPIVEEDESRSYSAARDISDPEEGQCSSPSLSRSPQKLPTSPPTAACSPSSRVSSRRDTPTDGAWSRSPVHGDHLFGEDSPSSSIRDSHCRPLVPISDLKERSRRSHKKKSKKSHKHRHNGSSLLSSSSDRHSRRHHSKKSKKSKRRHNRHRDSSEESGRSSRPRSSKRRRKGESVTSIPPVVSLSPSVDEIIDLTSPVIVQSGDNLSPRSCSDEPLPASASSLPDPEPLGSSTSPSLTCSASLVSRLPDTSCSTESLTSRLSASVSSCAGTTVSVQGQPASASLVVGNGVSGVTASSEVVARMSQNLKSRLDMLMSSSSLSTK